MPAAVFGVEEIENHNKYGVPVDFSTNPDYPGSISIDGMFVYKDNSDFIFTVLYSNGKLINIEEPGKKIVQTSFFNSPNGDKLKISWINNTERISSKNKIIQY